MRVDLLITGLDIIGGAEVFVRQISPKLIQSGVGLHVITVKSGGVLINELRNENVQVTELGIRNKNDLSVFRKLNELWNQDKPDVLHTHLFHAGIIGRVTGKYSKIPKIIVHQHGYEYNRTLRRILFDKLSSNLVTQYIVSCEAVAKILQTREKINNKKISIVYNGIDLYAFDHSGNLSENIDHLLRIGSPLVCSIGRLEPEKGQKEIILAINRLLKQGQDVNLLLVGSGSSEASLKKLTRDLGLEEKILFTGTIREIPSLLSRIDIFVLASKWEGISMAILEAMAARKPVIATAVGGTPELINHQHTGLLVQVDDETALSNAIIHLLRNPALCKSFGEEGRHRIEKEFQIDKTINQIINIYEKSNT